MREEDAAVLKRTFLHARAGPWRVSVSRNMWPDIPIAAPRVFGKFKRWVQKADQLVRIVWDDNEEGTHALDHLIEHELSFEDGENGEPAPELLTEEPAPRSRPPRPASPSDSGSSSASESDTEAVRPPLATASTKAGTSWRHELTFARGPMTRFRRLLSAGWACKLLSAGLTVLGGARAPRRIPLARDAPYRVSMLKSVLDSGDEPLAHLQG